MKTTGIQEAMEPVQDALRKVAAIAARPIAPIGHTSSPTLCGTGALPVEAPCPTEQPIGSGDDFNPAISAAARPIRTCAAILSERQQQEAMT